MARSRYASGVPREPESFGLPKPPEFCSVVGCECPAQVMAIAVRDGSHEFRAAPLSVGKKAPGGSYELRPGLEFVEWVARCADHMLREQVATRRNRWLPVVEDDSLLERFDRAAIAGLLPQSDGAHVCAPELARRLRDERKRNEADHLEGLVNKMRRAA